MALMENDFLGENSTDVLATLRDLGIEITHVGYYNKEVMFIETAIDYSIEFCDGICCWSGYEGENNE